MDIGGKIFDIRVTVSHVFLLADAKGIIFSDTFKVLEKLTSVDFIRLAVMGDATGKLTQEDVFAAIDEDTEVLGKVVTLVSQQLTASLEKKKANKPEIMKKAKP